MANSKEFWLPGGDAMAFGHVPIDPTTGLLAVPRDFYAAVGYGAVPGYRRVTALGNNPGIDTGTTPEDIWAGGGLYPWKTAAGPMEVFSANAADTSAGTGARTVLVSGLDANHVEISETATLNGATVALVNQYLRINSARVVSAGSGERNAGDISVRDAGAGTVRAIIPATYSLTRSSAYTVPAGHTLQIVSMLFCFNRVQASSRFGTFVTVSRVNGVQLQSLELTIGDEPPYRHDGVPGIIVAEKNDFVLRSVVVSNDNADVTAAWLGILRNNSTAIP